MAIDPQNPMALKNLGDILWREDDSLRALLLPAPVLPGQSKGPTDGVRPGLRLHGAGGHRAGPEALPDGAGYAGAGGAARPGQEWATRDCRGG
jgi:hypothetical protein